MNIPVSAWFSSCTGVDPSGFVLAGTELRTVHVEFDKSGRLEVTAGGWVNIDLPKAPSPSLSDAVCLNLRYSVL